MLVKSGFECGFFLPLRTVLADMTCIAVEKVRNVGALTSQSVADVEHFLGGGAAEGGVLDQMVCADVRSPGLPL